MTIIPQDEAFSILEPHIPTIVACWDAAWQKWEKIGQEVPEARVDVRSRAQSNLLYDLMCAELKRRFEGVPGVTWTEKGGFLTLNFEDKLLLRFKKIDKNKRSHNINTRQQVMFRLQVSLPGFPDEPTRGDIGYRLDDLSTKLEDFLVTCHTGKKLEWFIPLLEPNEGQAGEPLPFPLPPQPSTPPAQIRRKKAPGETKDAKPNRETGSL
jgi:hypothetical protein